MWATTCNPSAMAMERWLARAGVTLTGLFWAASAFGAEYAYRNTGPLASMEKAVLPLVLAVVVLAVSCLNEYVTGLVLFTGAAIVAAWGVFVAWEMVVWVVVGVTLIVPVMIAGVLFLLASRMDTICNVKPQTADATA